MPRILPSDQFVRHHCANTGNSGATPTASDAEITEDTSKTSVAHIANSVEAKYWHNRLISFCRQKITRFISPPPTIKTSELVGRLTQHSRERDSQKVLAALKLHAGRAIKLHQSANGRLSYTDSKVAISTETMAAVVKSIKRNPVSVAYEYLRKGEQLPAGYLRQIIVPHMIKTVNRAMRYQSASGLPVSRQQSAGRFHFLQNPQQFIAGLLERSGMGDEKSISLERMLAFKQLVRNNLVQSVEEQRRQLNRLPATDLSPAPDRPSLPKPGNTTHFIEQEDRKHIEKLTCNDHFFAKTRFRDLGNSIKRAVLRNKRNHIVTILCLVAGSIVTAIFPPAGIAVGIAVAVGLGIDVAYVVFWTVNNALWHRVRLVAGLKKLKKFSEFDYTTFDQTGDKKRKKLIKNLRFRCQHKTFTGIYDAYAELEKQAIKLDQMARDNDNSLASAIALEKEQALYRKRRRELKANIFFFDKLIEQVAISRSVMEGRHRQNLELLWQEKFATMDPATCTRLFSQVASDVVVAGHQVKTHKPNWLRNTIKYFPGLQSAFAKGGTEITPRDKDHSKLREAGKTLQSLSKAAIYRSVKQTFFENLIKLRSIIKRKATLTINEPFSSLPAMSNFLVFVAFFFIEMGVARVNSSQNQTRADAIKDRKKSYTRQLFGSRVRTGREEVATLRSQAKDDVEPLVDHLLASMESMEKIGNTLADARQRNAMLGQENFANISNEEAARFIITHCAWQGLLDKQISGAFSQFHDIVFEKARAWHHRLGKSLVANSKRVLLGAPDRARHLGQKTPNRPGRGGYAALPG